MQRASYLKEKKEGGDSNNSFKDENKTNFFFFFKSCKTTSKQNSPVTGRTPYYFLGVKTCAKEEPSGQLSADHSNLLCLGQKVVLSWGERNQRNAENHRVIRTLGFTAALFIARNKSTITLVFQHKLQNQK